MGTEIAIWMIGSLLMIFMTKTQGNVYLKSSTASVDVLEGHDVSLNWQACDENARFPPCQWLYATNRSEQGTTFLAYQNGQRFEYTNKETWHFTKSQEPCTGGIRKEVKMKDAGTYMMQMDAGYRVKSEDSKTTIKVYRARDLTYTVTVNGEVTKFDLSSGTSQTLTQLVTYQPVTIKVALSKSFPPSEMVITRDAGLVSCNGHFVECTDVIDLKNGTDATIVIRIQTGIIGADPITIHQPVMYYIPADNSVKHAAITFGVLFFLTLIILIIVIVWLITVNRKARKQNEVKSESVQRWNPTTLQHGKREIRDTWQDLLAAFHTHPGHRHHEDDHSVRENPRVIKELSKTVRTLQETYDSKKNTTADSIKRAKQSTRDLLERCNLVDVTTKSVKSLCLELLRGQESDLSLLDTKLESNYDSVSSHLKELEKLMKAERETVEMEACPNDAEHSPQETDRMNMNEVPQSNDSLVTDIQHSKTMALKTTEVLLQTAIADLEWIGDQVDTIRTRINIANEILDEG